MSLLSFDKVLKILQIVLNILVAALGALKVEPTVEDDSE